VDAQMNSCFGRVDVAAGGGAESAQYTNATGRSERIFVIVDSFATRGTYDITATLM
jgi:hypothetical protein